MGKLCLNTRYAHAQLHGDKRTEAAARVGEVPASVVACVCPWAFSVLGHTTDVADANAVGIMPQAMGTSYVLGTSLVDAAVTIDDIVITYVSKLACQVPTTNVVHREVLAFGGCRTVNDQFSDFSHCVVRFAIGYSFWFPRP